MVQSTLNTFIFSLVLRQIRTNLKASSSLSILKHSINTFAFFSSDFWLFQPQEFEDKKLVYAE